MRTSLTGALRPWIGLAVCGLLVCFAPQAAALLNQWGTQAGASAADCPSFCTNFDFAPTLGGPLQSSASTGIDSLKGTANALAELDPSSGLALPTLKAEAFSNQSSTGAFGTAFAVEGYTFNGVAPTTFTLDFFLDGTVIDPTPLDGDTFVNAEIVFYQEAPFFFSSDRATLELELGAVPIDSARMSLIPGITSDQASISVTLAPGESVYVWAFLRAAAERDLSSADAFSTLTASFQNPTGLTAASQVPEPGVVGFFLLASLGFASLRGPSVRLRATAA